MSATTVPSDSERSPEECTLCGLATGDAPVADEAVPGTYCCRGCLEVARSLDDVEAADPEAAADELDTGAEDAPDDADHTFLAVEGMHCATCETFIESVAADADGVYGAQASYATDVVRVAHEEAADLDAVEATLDRYGYAVTDPESGTDEDGADAQVVRFLLGGGMFGMMVMVWYALFLYPSYLGYEPFVDLGGFDGLYLFGNVWLMTSIVLFYTGYPLLRGAVVSLRAGQPNMDLLVSLAAASSYLYSSVAVAVGRTHVYFDVTVAIVLVVTLGNYYEDRIKRRAASGLSELTSARVREATRVTDDGDETVHVADLAPGDRVLVRPGERVPVDGEVVEGTAAVDESLVTGESVPETRRPGDRVLGGTVVTDDPVVVAVGEDADSTLDRLVDLLWEVQSSRSGVQRLADRLATLFVPTVLALALVATGWHLLGGATVADALLAGLTVLIVSCPCALGLATPLAVASGVREAVDRGVVVTSEAIFEGAPEVDVVVLDKTGTLTDGEMTVGEVVADDPEAVLSRAAALERFSAHPVAEAVASAVEDPAALAAESVESHDRGVTGAVAGEGTAVGHPSLLEGRGFAFPDEYRAAVADVRESGGVAVAVGWAGRVRGVVAVGDAPRPEWERAVADLSADREVVVLTGDDERAAAAFEANPEVSEVFAGVPPEAKAETVERLKARGTVAMVGDGSNDAPALAAADVGIALASGTDLAGDAADAVVVDGGLDAVAEAFAVAAGTSRRIRRNLGWAFLYNAVAVPLAALGLLNPLFAAVAMGASSLLVVANSARPLD
ncbi:cation-translocating P-type ATPase [Halorussus salilacus]|uniref:heavy metal translocating P-type ATPase n=1 Tax=Halorussus salilacus TaxID=2953750 RepID=UPI00209E5CB3|nr:cation-translocating P-type ATPase [Halorussus salilacus]USZ69433.1 cation-translocating P-type ATPase [Halorussus salilacus]